MRSPERIATLDGWRAIAIGFVVAGHLGMSFYDKAPDGPDIVAFLLSQFASFGVDIFFGLSGLLITTLLLRERDEYGSISLAAFYTRRAFRILPPCFVYLAAAALVLGVASRWELISSVFFFRNYLPERLGAFGTAHLWSLAVEEHFYFLWPVLLITAGFRYGARGVAWISIACGLWRVADAYNQITVNVFPEVNPHLRTDLRLDALLWGCVIAMALASGQKEQLRKIGPVWFAGLGVAAMAGVILYSHLTALLLAMIVPILLSATMLHPEWKFSRVLDHPVARFVGRRSYSLYLWQGLFLYHGWESRYWFQHAPWNVAGACVFAILSYRFVEKPCMDLGRQLSARIRLRVSAPQLAPVEASQSS